MFKAVGMVSLLLEAALGQSANPPRSFEAAEIQPANGVDSWVSVGLLPNGHVRCHNAGLRMLIAAAYDRDEDLATGGPAWLDSERFDIIARTAANSKDDLQLMLQTLLGQRFKLSLRHTSKTQPVFTLTVGKDGLRLQPSAGSDKACPRGGIVNRQLAILQHLL
jgi:uncharacterized protein (TIGR03435 family)